MLFFFKTVIFFITAVVYTVLEYSYSILQSDDRYQNEETRDAILCGLVLVCTETASVFVFLFLTTRLYTYLWGALPNISLLQIIAMIIVIDFLYYLYHFAHHSNAKLYRIHKIHHIGTKYNLSLALMLPWLGQAYIYLMIAPLVMLHISPYSILSAYYFVLTYQLFSHIAYLKVPKALNIILITPQTHRIHHYHDKDSQTHNFGSVFSVWDKLFGTYSEDEKGVAALFGVAGHKRKNIFTLQKETVTQFFTK